MRRTCMALLVLLLAGLLVLGACGGTEPTTTPTPAVSKQPVGTVTIAHASLEEELFFPGNMSASPKVYIDIMYEYLVYSNPATGGMDPGLATSWSRSDDSKTWTFKLRQGVKFSDGSEMTAEDVKFSVGVVAATTSRFGQAALRKLDVTVADKYTVVFSSNTGKGVVDVEKLVANQIGVPILSKAYFDKVGWQGYEAAPIGTGPYVFKSKRVGDFISFEARPDWKEHWRVGELWQETGAFKEIVLKKVPEVSTRMAMLRTGEADIIEIGPDQVTEVKNLGLTLVNKRNAKIVMVTFGGDWLTEEKNYDPTLPWLKEEVRQALSLAINRQEISDKFYGGTASPIGGAVRYYPGIEGWDDNWQPDPYDPARARDLLTAAGYPTGFEMPFSLYTIAGSLELPALGEAVAGYWEKIGVRANIQRTEFTVHLGDMRERVFKGAQMFRAVPQSDYTSSLVVAFGSRAMGGLFGFFERPYLDNAMSTLLVTVDPQARKDLAEEVGHYLVDNYGGGFNVVIAGVLFAANPKTVAQYAPNPFSLFTDNQQFIVPAK